jgi:hypothetical protein
LESSVSSSFEDKSSKNQTQKAQKLASLLQSEWISSLNQVMLSAPNRDSLVSHSIQKRMEPIKPLKIPLGETARLKGDSVKGTISLPIEHIGNEDVPRSHGTVEVPASRSMDLDQPAMEVDKDFEIAFPEWKFLVGQLKIRYYNSWAKIYIHKNPQDKTWAGYLEWMRSSDGFVEFQNMQTYIFSVADKELQEYLARKLGDRLTDKDLKPLSRKLRTTLKGYGRDIFPMKEYFKQMIEMYRQEAAGKAKNAGGHGRRATEEMLDQILSDIDVRIISKETLFEAKLSYTRLWLEIFQKDNPNQQTWTRYREWTKSSEGLETLGYIRQQVLENAISTLKQRLPRAQGDIIDYLGYYMQTELDHELFVGKSTFELLLDIHHKGEKPRLNNEKPQKDEEMRSGENQLPIKREQLQKIWKIAGLGILASGLILGPLLALILPLTLHNKM